MLLIPVAVTAVVVLAYGWPLLLLFLPGNLPVPPGTTTQPSAPQTERWFPSDTDTGVAPSGPQGPAPTPASPLPPLPSRATEAEVAAHYRPLFTGLQLEYEGRLNSLLRAGLAEYRQARAGGGKVYPVVVRYVQAGRSLEAECDARFNALLEDMRRDLRKRGLPETLVEQARQTYTTMKNERRRQLLAQAISVLREQ